VEDAAARRNIQQAGRSCRLYQLALATNYTEANCKELRYLRGCTVLK